MGQYSVGSNNVPPAIPPAVVAAYASERGIDLDLLETARIHLELLYGEVAASWPGFIARPGQYKMMQACLLTFFSAKAPRDEDRPGDNLAQLEAGNLAFPGHAAQGAC
jgi:ATP-dependent DNA helicase DinG